MMFVWGHLECFGGLYT